MARLQLQQSLDQRFKHHLVYENIQRKIATYKKVSYKKSTFSKSTYEKET